MSFHVKLLNCYLAHRRHSKIIIKIEITIIIICELQRSFIFILSFDGFTYKKMKGTPLLGDHLKFICSERADMIV